MRILALPPPTDFAPGSPLHNALAAAESAEAPARKQAELDAALGPFKKPRG